MIFEFFKYNKQDPWRHFFPFFATWKINEQTMRCNYNFNSLRKCLKSYLTHYVTRFKSTLHKQWNLLLIVHLLNAFSPPQSVRGYTWGVPALLSIDHHCLGELKHIKFRFAMKLSETVKTNRGVSLLVMLVYRKQPTFWPT